MEKENFVLEIFLWPIRELTARNEWDICLLNLYGSDLHFQKSAGFIGVVALYHLPKLWLTKAGKEY